MSVVEIVKRLCNEKKISLHKLEMDCGFANGYIGSLKKGTMPVDRLSIIADYFNLPISYFLEDAQNGADVSLSEKISQLCVKNGITRNKFEIESGVGRGQSARWDKNKPSGDKLQKAADYFGVSIAYLLDESSNSSKESELEECLEDLRRRPETRALLEVSRGLTKEQVEKMAEFAKMLRGNQ